MSRVLEIAKIVFGHEFTAMESTPACPLPLTLTWTSRSPSPMALPSYTILAIRSTARERIIRFWLLRLRQGSFTITRARIDECECSSEFGVFGRFSKEQYYILLLEPYVDTKRCLPEFQPSFGRSKRGNRPDRP